MLVHLFSKHINKYPFCTRCCKKTQSGIKHLHIAYNLTEGIRNILSRVQELVITRHCYRRVSVPAAISIGILRRERKRSILPGINRLLLKTATGGKVIEIQFCQDQTYISNNYFKSFEKNHFVNFSVSQSNNQYVQFC